MMTIHSRRLTWLLVLTFFTSVVLLAGQTQGQQTPGNSSATKQSSTAASQTSTAKASSMPSAAEIAAAKTSGKVWGNLDSRIYHKGGRWYGKTKNGKFMTESEAKAAGYKKAKRN